MRAVEQLDTTREPGQIVSWLYRVSQNAIADYWRAFYRLPLVGAEQVAPGWEPVTPRSTARDAEARATAAIAKRVEAAPAPPTGPIRARARAALPPAPQRGRDGGARWASATATPRSCSTGRCARPRCSGRPRWLTSATASRRAWQEAERFEQLPRGAAQRRAPIAGRRRRAATRRRWRARRPSSRQPPASRRPVAGADPDPAFVEQLRLRMRQADAGIASVRCRRRCEPRRASDAPAARLRPAPDRISRRALLQGGAGAAVGLAAGALGLAALRPPQTQRQLGGDSPLVQRRGVLAAASPRCRTCRRARAVRFSTAAFDGYVVNDAGQIRALIIGLHPHGLHAALPPGLAGPALPLPRRQLRPDRGSSPTAATAGEQTGGYRGDASRLPGRAARAGAPQGQGRGRPGPRLDRPGLTDQPRVSHRTT